MKFMRPMPCLQIRQGQLDALVAQKFKTAGDVIKFIQLRDELYSLASRHLVCRELLSLPCESDILDTECAGVASRIRESQMQFERAASQCHLILPAAWTELPKDKSGRRLDAVLEAAGMTQIAQNDLNRLDAVLRLSHHANEAGVNTASTLASQKSSLAKAKAGLQETGALLRETNTIANQTAGWFSQWRS